MFDLWQSLFALYNLNLCADFRPEPAIVTIRCASYVTDRHHQQSQHHQLGNDLCYCFDLLYILKVPETWLKGMTHVNLK
jgi:hypothetical protein